MRHLNNKYFKEQNKETDNIIIAVRSKQLGIQIYDVRTSPPKLIKTLPYNSLDKAGIEIFVDLLRKDINAGKEIIYEENK